jgi:hypothetical protein
MADFSGMVAATGVAWDTTQKALDAIKNMTEEQKKDPAAMPRLLLNAQMELGIATSLEQKTSSAIDKAYQAHGQVASK